MPSHDPECLLYELGITLPEQIDIEAIAQYCGATVLHEPLKGCEGRLLGYHNKAIITVNHNASPRRRRFSAAHELGHWMKHRGEVALVCESDQLIREWAGHRKEGAANRYAAELLLPRYLFKPMLKDKPLTFATINTLATRFQTSLTATAIRLVQFTNRHAVLICSSQEGRTWFEPSKSVTAHQNWPRRTVSPKSAAYTLLHRDEEPAGPKSVPASVWFGGEEAARAVVMEDTIRITSQLVLSLVVWSNVE